MNEHPQRKTPAHLPVRESFNKVIIVFLTVCTDKKRTILARSDIHDLLRTVWTHADHWRVGRYVIMPDHIHLFCSPGRLDSLPLTRWVQFWKSAASRQWPRNLDATKRVPPNNGGPRSVVAEVWQKSYWDTQLRKGGSYSEKWEYVRHNPVRAGLCPSPDDWPFQGELNTLMWHD